MAKNQLEELLLQKPTKVIKILRLVHTVHCNLEAEAMNKEYKNIIFTNHALERLKDRSINYSHIADVINYSEKKFHTKENTWKFIKTINQRKIHTVASYLKKENKWLVISVWVRGEDDKVPLIWQLLTLTFRLFLSLIKKVLKF